MPHDLPDPAADATTKSTPTVRRDRTAWWLLAMVLVALLLRLPLLDRPIWFDEACMSDQRIGTLPQLLATLYVDIHPPLFVTLMHVWNRVFGDGEVVMRLPALLAGLSCIPLTFWTGHRLVGAPAAWLAAALLVLSPVHVWYCAEARLYAPMIACTLLAFGTTDRLLDAGGAQRRGLLTAHLVNVAVMLLLHYYLAVIVLALAVFAPVLARGVDRSAFVILLAHGVGILLLAGFVLVKHALGQFETSQDYLVDLDLAGLYHFVCDWAWTGDTLQTAPSALVRDLGVGCHWLGVALLALGTGQLLRARRARPRGWLVLAGILTLPAFLFACVAAGYPSTYLERTLIPALPFVLLLAAAGAESLANLSRPLVQVARALALLCAAGALVALYDGYDDRWTLYKPHPDWRSAARWLGDEIDAGGSGRAVYTSMPNPRSLSYYDARIQSEKNLRAPVSVDAIRSSVSRRLGGWFGELAARQFAAFEAHNQRLLRDTRLLVFAATADPARLQQPPQPPDAICYVVRNNWHPHSSVDDSVERLLAHPRTRILEQIEFQGVTVSKVEVTP